MHETSLVRALLEQVDRLCADHGGSSVSEVRVQMGPLSGVEPALVASAFERLKQETSAAADADLVIDQVPLTAICCACGLESEIQDYCFRCAHCAHDHVRVVRGDGFCLESITLDAAAFSPSSARVTS